MRLPSKERLEYIKVVLETLLLLLITPVALFAFLKDPGKAAERAVASRGLGL